MIYWTMKTVNIILVVISIWPLLSEGHVMSLQTSLSSIQEVEDLPKADAFVGSRNDISTTKRLINKPIDGEETSSNTITFPPNHQKENALDDTNGNNDSLLVSYNFFTQHCNLAGTQLRCDDHETFPGSTECIPPPFGLSLIHI